MNKKKKKTLSPKQHRALELLTSGKGMKYKDIAAEVGINNHTLWDWLHEPAFTHFQDELKRINDDRWMALVDAARESASRLVANDNQKMTEFVLKNAGYNPTQKIEADVNQDIVITVGFDEEEQNGNQ